MASACKGDEFWHLMGGGNDSSDLLPSSYLLPLYSRRCEGLGVGEDEDVR